MPTTGETEVPGPRRSKRLSYSPTSHPTWVILHETGARDDDSTGDRAMSLSSTGDRAMSLSSTGELIRVSFVLMEPPRISFLAVDVPQRPRPTEPIRSDVNVLAAHGDVVLFELDSRCIFDPAPVDYFVYRASSGKPSLLLLPVQYYGKQMIAGRRVQHLMRRGLTGILSTRSSTKEDASFVVADLRRECPESQCDYGCRPARKFDLHVLWSGSDKWMVFKNLHIRGTKRGHELNWWSTDAVVPYRNRYLIWVDYYQGLIFVDMARPEKKPDLWYVPLPVDPLRKDPFDMENGGPGYPDTSRNLCVTSSGLKFVSVDHHRSTNSKVGHRKQTGKFWITIWSLRDDGVTWRRDERLYAEDLWALDSNNSFPHVEPVFPIIDMENPNAVCFVVEEDHIISGYPNRRYMVEIDMRKKIILEVTDYSKEPHLFSLDSVKIATELPSYLSSGEACKKRRQ